MRIPGDVKEEVRKKLYEIAESVSWESLSAPAKAKFYEEWTRSPQIGAILSAYMDKGKVRVYLKDTLLKDYSRRILVDSKRPMRVLGLSEMESVEERYIKPHGLRLVDGRIICWGRAEDWKLVLMALYERTREVYGAKAHGVVLLNAIGRFDDTSVRAIVEEAADRLRLGRVVWLGA